ncbi:MAG TPA: metallophosphoesterase [Elusimicrobia bacterium]|nr:metallophosphoesterase [Elusimicrobiota bacterium]
MLYGIFSDVHANLEAFRAVLRFYEKNKVEHFICCGDLVGYGPQPRECVELVMALKDCRSVLGNHDAAVTGRIEMKWFNANALAAIEFARKNLSGAALAFLSALPEKLETPDFTVVHGSPKKPLTEYLLGEIQFVDSLKFWTVSPCFMGHTHMPAYFKHDAAGLPETDFLGPMLRVVSDGGRLMLNPGSVGQPRDGDPRSSCAVYDTENKVFEIFRVPYDIEKTTRLMSEFKMPVILGERLLLGF